MRRPKAINAAGGAFNMTPMIDVIFQLIIFFLCVNQFEKAESRAAVALPEAASPLVRRPSDPPAPRLVVTVERGGRWSVGGEGIQSADFEERLRRKLHEGRGAVEVWIRADQSCPFGRVEPLLAACAREGVWKVSFKVLRPTPPEETPP